MVVVSTSFLTRSMWPNHPYPTIPTPTPTPDQVGDGKLGILIAEVLGHLAKEG